ncbi:MAG: DEAD/DEAH box helicase [Chrysiogenetes bacterium]|nr:DEAD/DEAH box helicase [Chrysiogenetes bacterium]
MKFSELGLSPQLLKEIEKLGFEEPTPIQEQSIPPSLKGKDILGCAQTGTGKTAAFGIPIIEALIAGKRKGKGPFGLVLAPTRELADQIRVALGALIPDDVGTVCVVVGGANMVKQVQQLEKGPAILVATPGRLLDHLERKNLTLEDVGFFVLDEADRMLDMGFIPQVEKVLNYLPRQRQSLLFSATLPPTLGALELRMLKQPVKVSVALSGETAEGVDQYCYPVDKRSKIELLNYLLDEVEGPTIVFVKTKVAADQIYQSLVNRGKDTVEVIHGDRSQSDRNKALDHFKESKCRILVATDVASRGLDVDGISHVINFDIPGDADSYVHRIGRTARAGAVGRSSTFITFGETRDLKVIEAAIKKKIPEGKVPEGVLTHTALAPAINPAAAKGGRRGGPRRYV